MSRSLLPFLLLGIGLDASGQFPVLPTDSVIDHPGRWNHRVEAFASFDHNANTIYNELPLKLLQGGYLERELRQRSLDAIREKPRNSAGYDLESRLTWTGRDCFLGHRNWRPIVSIAYQEHMGIRFTDDLYDVTFFGNASFEGTRADLGPSAYEQVRYGSLGAGIRDARSNSFVRIDLVTGRSISQVDLKWGGLFTGEDGRVLRANILGDLFQSDTATSSLGSGNGLGAAVSGRWEIRAKRKTRPTTFAMEIQDLGFVRWNANAVRIEKDTLVIFEGFRVADLFDLDAALTGEAQLLDTFGLRYRTGGRTTLLPFRASGSMTMCLTGRWNATITIDQRNLPGYVPMVCISSSHRIGQRALLAGSLGYGGFGGLRVGAATRIKVGDRIRVNIGTPHLPGFLMGRMRGAGAMCGIDIGL
ncbi:MAG: hypothetical protein R2815_10380 [Flavobacteriales bacterium]